MDVHIIKSRVRKEPELGEDIEAVFLSRAKAERQRDEWQKKHPRLYFRVARYPVVDGTSVPDWEPNLVPIEGDDPEEVIGIEAEW